jgi:hypothetical protein
MIRELIGLGLIAAGGLIHLVVRRRECSMYYYIEFHADNGVGCTAGRRRFSDPRDADKFWDWIKADKHHRCNEHSGFSKEERLPEIGLLRGRYNSHPDRAALLKLTTIEPDVTPEIETLDRLQALLPRVAICTGSIGTPKGFKRFYQIYVRKPKGALWPKRQWPWMLIFLPLCRLNNRLVCEATSSES